MKRFSILACLTGLVLASTVAHGQDPLPSWNDGPPKQAIVEFVQATTEQASPKFVPPAERQYAYGPASGVPDTKVGTFPHALYDEAKKKGWIVISMKKDWNRMFAFEP